MSLIKSVFTEVNGHPINVMLPDKKTIILRGRNSLQVLYIVESLLSNDFTDYYRQYDKQFGLDYVEPTGTSQLTFNNGVILGQDGKIDTQGKIPNIHCVKYCGKGDKIRSFCVSNDPNYNQIYTDMTSYSGVIPDSSWLRLIALTNDIIGEEVVFFENNEISFKFIEDYDISIEGQKLIYMLLAECFLTPDDYSRVLLLPNLYLLPTATQVKLLGVLDNIIKHTLTLSTAEVTISDLQSTGSVSIINV